MIVEEYAPCDVDVELLGALSGRVAARPEDAVPLPPAERCPGCNGVIDEDFNCRGCGHQLGGVKR